MSTPGQTDPARTGPPGGPLDAVARRSLDDASQRLVRRVDALPDEAYAEPSRLPGWSRAHVVAHLALNAESLARVLHEVAAEGEAAMYRTARERDADIDALATAPPDELRERLLVSTREFADALDATPADAWEGGFRRLPDAPELLPLGQVPGMRHREVELHHVDLGCGYDPMDWPGDFAAAAVTALRGRAPEATLLATDLGRTWHAEPARVTVSGPAPRLVVWLSGRGDEGLTSNGGDLPRIEEW